MSEPSRFIQIATGGQRLYALDENGCVWRYYPARKDKAGNIKEIEGRKSYATWIKITNHRIR
jgi:hypothetical protein